MITIESLVEQGANVKLEVTPADLKMFAEAIVQRTMAARQEELNAEMRRGCGDAACGGRDMAQHKTGT